MLLYTTLSNKINQKSIKFNESNNNGISKHTYLKETNNY